MSAVKQINPQADVIGSRHSLLMNITAAKSLAEVLKSNLGPRGTLKMLISGAGLIKITKDGQILLEEMQIQHPTAALIARSTTAQHEMVGDGTTSNVLFIGELLSQCEKYLHENIHPRVLVDGIELARERILSFLDTYTQTFGEKSITTELLMSIAKSALATKVYEELANHLTGIVVNCIQTIAKAQGSSSTNNNTVNPDTQIPSLDLHMIEILTMKHQSALDTRFVDGLVLDHGARHPDMPKRIENCHIMIFNVSLEYEKSEVNAGFFYKNADEKSKLVAAERKYTDDKVNAIIAFKNRLEKEDGKPVNLVVINQKGIDPISLDMLQKHNIVGIRRAKRRNMERLSRACGGYQVNSVDNLERESLGFAKLVYEHTLGDDKFTFIEGCQNPTSCTILIRGPNDHTIRQIQDAVHDGLRAVANFWEDRKLVSGAGAFEIASHLELVKYKNTVSGKAKMGIQAFADAILVIPKTLAANSGLDSQATLFDVMEETDRTNNNHIGIDITTGKPVVSEKGGIWDNYRVKKQFLHLASLISIKLLLVDEVMRAGRKMGGK